MIIMGSLLLLYILFKMLRIFIGERFIMFIMLVMFHTIYTLQLHGYYTNTCISRDKK